MLALRVQTLTDDEKAEAAADPLGRAVLAQVEALTTDDLRRLHGSWRTPAIPGPGQRVRLQPRRGGDMLDLVLAGHIATVQTVEHDAEGQTWLTVTLDADPGRDLGAAGWPGHRFFFRLAEIEVLP